MFKAVPKEIKEEILGKVRNGLKAPTLAKQYGISAKTIYNWLSRMVTPEVSISKFNQLRRENEELKRIIGMISFDLEQEKKRKIYPGFKQ